MINLPRPGPPGCFTDSLLRDHQRERVRKWFDGSAKQRDQKSFAARWANEIPGFMLLLREFFNDKCAFCETKVTDQPDELVLAFFRPTEGALQLDGSSDFKHYSWLSWEWENLYLACSVCIRAKGQTFPTKRDRAEPDSYGAKLQEETPLLLDPCLDDPAKHLVFNETGDVVPLVGSERAEVTIEVLNLNRNELVQARAEEAQKTNALLQTYLDSSPTATDALIPIVVDLRSRCAAAQPYAGTARQVLDRWLKRDEVVNHPNAWILQNLLNFAKSSEPGSDNPKPVPRSREQLVDEFFEIGDTLENLFVHRAFLSVDVVGSTELKKGEHHLAVAFSFQKFRSLVDAIIAKHDALQYCWGGDGLMSSYDKTQNAVDAATELIESLRDFNRLENRLSKPFKARCGASSGEVHDDPSEDLERKTSPVIDLTGHLQKEARPDGLLISEFTFSEIENRAAFHEFDHEMDGQKVWEYGPSKATDY